MDKKKEIQIAELMRRQRLRIERLEAENGVLKGEKRDGLDGPVVALLDIVLSEKEPIKQRIDAAGTILAYNSSEAATDGATAFLSWVSTHGTGQQRIDAAAALMKREVPKAALPGTATAPSKAERARQARRLLMGRARLENHEMMERARADAAEGKTFVDESGNMVDLTATFHSPTLQKDYAKIRSMSDDEALGHYPVVDSAVGMADRLYAARMRFSGLGPQAEPEDTVSSPLD